jgi:glutathione S-transferase
MMRVLGRVTSINVRKVLWALDELGLQYEREDWGLPLRDPTAPEFLALNPNAQVPVLIEADGTTMWESNGILVYLAMTRKQLLPDDRGELALALQWLGWQATELNPPWGYALNALVRKTPGFDDPVRIASSIARWTAKMEMLENQLSQHGPFIAGRQFSIADIALGLSVHRWVMTPFEKQPMPLVKSYYNRLQGRDAGSKWMTEKTP